MPEEEIVLSNFLREMFANLLDTVDCGPLDVQMVFSDATAKELVADRNGRFGADVLRFPPGGSVPMHKHRGAHILIVIGGSGKLVRNDGSSELYPGVVYLVPEDVAHEIVAGTNALTLIAVGNYRFPPDSEDRLMLDQEVEP